MRRIVLGLMIVAALVAASMPLMAHHSFAAEFDANKTVKMTGVVTKIDWTNPHVWFYLDVKDESGKVTNWGFEMGPPHLLQGTGWTRTTMKIGDTVTVQGYCGKERNQPSQCEKRHHSGWKENGRRIERRPRIRSQKRQSGTKKERIRDDPLRFDWRSSGCRPVNVFLFIPAARKQKHCSRCSDEAQAPADSVPNSPANCPC